MESKYGISSCLSGKLGRAEFFSAVARAGFRYAELSGDPVHLENWIADPDGTRRDAEKHGVTVLSVHTPEAGWKSNAPDEKERRASIEAAAAVFEPARRVGARSVIIHPTNGDFLYTPETYDGHCARAVQSLTELAERAAAAGIRMAVENLPARRKPRPGVRVAEVMEMIRGLGDHVGICVDAGHSNSNQLSAAEDARMAGRRLFAVHIQDNDGRGEDMHLVPGNGTTDWPAFVKALDAAGFSEGRMFEVPAISLGVDETLATLAALVRQWHG